MAIMVPDTIRASTRSSAERNLFNRLRTELPDDCYVLHSLGLSQHASKLWGEADFVILSRFGIFVIEVKGGRVACQDGTWVFTDRHGTEYRKPEGPFEQAKTAMFAVRAAVEEAHPDLMGLLHGYGVIMPDETFTAEGPEIEPKVLLDRRHYTEPFDNYLEQLSAFWSAEYQHKHGGKRRRYPDRRDLASVRQVLRPDIHTALTLNSSLCQIEEQQVALTEEQGKILRRMDSNPRTLVRGGAGTGKTLLALDVATRRAQEGKRVLFLCFNRLLGQHVREHVASHGLEDRLEADSLHSWFRRIIARANMEAALQNHPKSDEEFYNRHFANTYAEAVIELDLEPFDYLVLDEAQDLLRPSFMDAYDLSLSNGMAEGKWHLFMDPQQAIFSGVDEELMTRLEGYGRAMFDLTVNCRNALKVAVSTSILSGIEMPLEGIVEGGGAEVKFYKDAKEELALLDRWVRKLVDEGVDRTEMIILSRHKLCNSGLDPNGRIAGLQVHDLTSDNPPQVKKCIEFCTMQAFKGLERRVVIAWDLSDLSHDEARMLHYCGLSRARSFLVVFLSESERQAYDRFAGEFGRKQAIAL